jgi:HNH endonuclease
MLRFLIAQAIAFSGFGLWKLARYHPVKPIPVPQPMPKFEIVVLGQSPRYNGSTKARYERIPLTARQRFEILKRDGFTCQYCGRKPPEVVLNVDHIIAVYNGGTNDPTNLITSCVPCNQGKGAIPLEAVG